MAGSDAPQNAKSEDTLANSLINNGHQSADNLQHERLSNPPGNADKHAALPDTKVGQNGGAAAPPETATSLPKVEVVHKAGQDNQTDKSAKPEVVVDAKALDVMHKVNGILDNEVPKLNQAHDLNGAKDAYERAVAAAKTLTPEQIQKAQQDLVEVRKEKAAETDPAKKRDLANKEADLYTITRLKDAALGNEALWYYRQNDVKDGNAKLLEAAGIDPATAKAMGDMKTADSQAKLGQFIKDNGVAPIFGDVNFNRQMVKIQQSGVQVPEVFNTVHKAVLEYQAQAGKASDGGATDSHANDNTGGKPTAPFDAVQNAKDIQTFVDTANKLSDKGGPLDAATKAALDKGIKAVDAQNLQAIAELDKADAAYNAVMPKDKQIPYRDASNKVNDEIGNIAKANKGVLPDAVKDNLKGMLTAQNADDYNKSVAALKTAAPALAADLKAASDLLPGDPMKGQQALNAYLNLNQAMENYSHTSQNQIKFHATYAQALVHQKTPPDAADLKQAQDMLVTGFANTPKEVRDVALADPSIKQVAKDVKLDGAPDAAAATDNTAAAGKPGKPGDNSLANADVATLQKDLVTAINKHAAGMKDGKAIYEELIRRAEDPSTKATANAVLTENLAALKNGKTADGKPLDAAGRIAINQENVEAVRMLSTAATLHSEYALYLSDGRLALSKDALNSDQSDNINQLKSMDAQQRAAIAASDAIDPNMLKQVNANIEAERKAQSNDPAAMTKLNDLKAIMTGGTTSDGSGYDGFMNQRVVLRDQLAALYLQEGAQFKQHAQGVAGMPVADTHKTDELFRPQDSLKLLTESKQKYQDLYGQGAQDLTTQKLFAMGQALSPDTFKGEANRLREGSADVLSNLAAMATSVAGSSATRFVASALTEGKVSPMAINLMSDGAAIGTGIVTRHIVHGAITGKSESWADSAINGSAAALMPIGFRYGSQYMSRVATATGENAGFIQKVAGLTSGRFAGMDAEAVINRTASKIGKDATFAETAQAFRASGLNTQAEALEKLGARPVSSMTPQEAAAFNAEMNLNRARAGAAAVKLDHATEGLARDHRVADALGAQGITNVEQLNARLATDAQRVTGLNAQVESASIKGLKDSTSVKDALRKMTVGEGAEAKPLYATSADLDKEVKFLNENKIKNLGDLRKASADAHSFFTVDNLYPELSASGTGTIHEALGTGRNVFGPAGSEGRSQLARLVPEEHPMPRAGVLPAIGRKISGTASGIGGSIKDKVWDNRFYKVQFAGSPVSFPNFSGDAAAASAVGTDGQAAAQGGLRSMANRITPEFNVGNLKPKFTNLGRLDLSNATTEQLTVAGNQTKFLNTTIASTAPIIGYNSVNSLYNNWYKGKNYEAADGSIHKYDVLTAIEDGNLGGKQGDPMVARALTGFASQILVGGFFLKGASAPILEDAAPAAKGAASWVLNKVPQLNYGRDAVAGSGAALKSFGMYGALGSTEPFQAYVDMQTATDRDQTVQNMYQPLTDAADPTNTGSIADDLRARQAQPAQPDASTTPDAATRAPETPAAATDNGQTPGGDQPAAGTVLDTSSPGAAAPQGAAPDQGMGSPKPPGQ